LFFCISFGCIQSEDRVVIDGAQDEFLSIIVFGASGDLAKKKTYPSLWRLFKKGFLPKNFVIVGFGRNAMTDEEFRDKILEKVDSNDLIHIQNFKNNLFYFHSQIDNATIAKVDTFIKEYEAKEYHDLIDYFI